MTKAEKQDLEALKIGFEMTEWEDFLLVYNEIKQRDKDIIKLYRKSHIKVKKMQQNIKELEDCLNDILGYGDTGEDARDIKTLIKNTLNKNE